MAVSHGLFLTWVIEMSAGTASSPLDRSITSVAVSVIVLGGQ
jgi:hypothetical protein